MPAQVVPIHVTNVFAQNGQLFANVAIGGHTVTAPVTVTAQPNSDPTACPILNLHLDAIHLDLLGAVVDTSPICLDVTAMPGNGNLLGNLLCDVAGLLNNGVPLGNILGGLSTTQLTTLLNGITGLLNGAFSAVTAPTASPSVSGPNTNILNLSLGPVNLNLLGLDVHLDNCNNGPVTVALTAEPGTLLGGLLIAVANLLNGGGSLVALASLLTKISTLLALL